MVLHKKGLYYYMAAYNDWYRNSRGISLNMLNELKEISLELLNHSEESLNSLKNDSRFFQKHDNEKERLINHLEEIKTNLIHLLEMKHIEDNFIKNKIIPLEDKHAFYDRILAVKVALEEKSRLFLTLENKDIIKSELERHQTAEDHLKENIRSWF
jgi:hypothetical protein